MRGLLLDTHALLWMVLDDPRLSKRARRQIEKVGKLAYSAASLWEIGLKLSRRGFDFKLPPTWDHDLIRELRGIGASRIEIEPGHCRRLQDLPWHHKDPFDRMFIAQAQVEGLTILTADERFKSYDVNVVWD
jgi:PIN domain nuclease of toxin-antitoxin system